ncbi:helix-turn-helix domain-containing protein [Chitiniphilus eburneus]|uniref:Transcriptional regulator n=1 Tax=Chitiniphilus eburneus TaxID=2571148 RepID=A0A4U0PJ67_9NEIS|nr:helix-turn-helix domain-containing protein [Chitiniphilus eburneus]TJZ67977.1 transcriptional regulator [Chitiniphilus eburneus]
MQEADELLQALKRHLREQGITYRALAEPLGLSEASIKRLFASGRFTLDRLGEICRLADITLAELALAAQARHEVSRLSAAQEAELVADELLLLVAVCALNHWQTADMLAHYRLDEPTLILRLVRLDRLGLIALLPGNRIRLAVARDFDWLQDGPIRRYFRTHAEGDFLAHGFADEACFSFSHGMLTPAARDRLIGLLATLRREFALEHQASLPQPVGERRGHGLLVALREWEPSAFAKYRRIPSGA